MDLLSQFLTIYSVFMLGAMSPGPDAIVLLKTAIGQGRRSAYVVAAGLGLSIFIMTQYILMGMGYLFQTFPVLIYVVQYGGAAFLLYLGIQSLRSGPGSFDAGEKEGGKPVEEGGLHHLRNGFMTNFLNPFAILYLVSLFAPILSQPIAYGYKLLFSLVLGLTYFSWNSLLSFVPTNKFLKSFFDRYAGWVQKISGVLLILIALKYALKSL